MIDEKAGDEENKAAQATVRKCVDKFLTTHDIKTRTQSHVDHCDPFWDYTKN